MRKFYAFLALSFVSLLAAAQSDRYWVGASGGSWTNSSNWSLTAGGAGGAGAPTSLQNAIFDGYVGSVNFDAANITINSLRILNSADVTISTPVTTARTLTINDGLTTSQDLRVDATSKLTLTTASGISGQFALAPFGALVDGIIILKGSVSGGSGGRIDAANATTSSPVEFNGTLELQDGCSNTAGTNFKFNSNAYYLIKKSGGNIPAGVWDANAEIQFLGLPSANTTSGPTFNGPPSGGFGRFIFNCATQSQTINLSLSSLGTIFNGDFRVLNTNGAILRLSTTLTNVLMKGNLQTSAGTKVSMTNSSTAPTGNISLTVNGDVTINGLFDLQESASGGNSYLKLKGGLTVAAGGTLAATGNGTTSTHEIEFLGTAMQNLAVNGSLTGIPQFKINGAGVQAATNLTLPAGANSKLALTSGHLDMGSNTLYVQNAATNAVIGGTLSAHIIGKMRRATNAGSPSVYLFPVSDSKDYVASVKITPSAATGTDYQVQLIRPNPYRNPADRPAGINSISAYYWDISRPTGTLGADLNFSFGGVSGFAGATDPTTVQVLRWNGSSPWENLGASGTVGSSVDINGITSFTQFALGSSAPEAPLPVNLLSFSALRSGSAVSLKWTVSQEQNLKGYELLRSTDGQNWATVANINSLGNTAAQRSYAYTDNAAGSGKQFYRLRSVDASGSAKLSNVAIVNSAKGGGLVVTALYPNPAADKLTLQLQSPSAGRVTLSVSDLSGREVYRQSHLVEEGVNPLQINTALLQKGIYTLQVTSASETTQQKFSKQ